MKKNLVLSASIVLATSLAGTAFWACGGDDNGTSPGGSDAASDATFDAGESDSGMTTIDTGVGDVSQPIESGPGTPPAEAGPDTGIDAGTPPPPALGVQIDRLGRPAINTALNHGFDGDASTAGAAKDSYNANTDAGAWVSSYTPEFAKNLAILDSLDTTDAGNGCGNQPFANKDAGAARYGTLAGVLANDRLWLNTGSTTCTAYLAVELNATGLMANTDCGGRKLSYDVIQTTYSVAAGVGLSGFGSGVNAVAAKTNGATFPYLAAPQ